MGEGRQWTFLGLAPPSSAPASCLLTFQSSLFSCVSYSRLQDCTCSGHSHALLAIATSFSDSTQLSSSSADDRPSWNLFLTLTSSLAEPGSLVTLVSNFQGAVPMPLCTISHLLSAKRKKDLACCHHAYPPPPPPNLGTARTRRWEG